MKYVKIWNNGHFVEGEVNPNLSGEIEYIVPSFAEPHIHGGWGFSFQKGEFEELEEKLRAIGVGLAIPTLMNSPLEEVEKLSDKFDEYKRKRKDSIFPFLRIEGPFISEDKKGAQMDDFILEPSGKNIEKFLKIKWVKMFTFAPEVKNSEKLIRGALELKKIPSIGHTNATFDKVYEAYKLGVRHMTHFPNAMRSLHHREVGAVGAGFLLDRLHLEVIGDFIHSSEEFISLVVKLRGLTFSLISDLIPPVYSDVKKWDGKKVVIKGREVRNEEGSLIGGGTPVPYQVSLFLERGFSPEQVVLLSSVNAMEFFRPWLASEFNLTSEKYVGLDNRFKPVGLVSI